MVRLLPFTRRRVTVLTVLVLALTLLASTTWIRLTEPRYQGKPMSYWFHQFEDLWRTNGTFTVDRQGYHLLINYSEVPSSEALVAMGDPAVDYLGRQISGLNPLNVSLYRRAYANLPISMRSVLPNPDEREVRRVAAAMALVPFGSMAQKQIPAIIDLAVKKAEFCSAVLLVLRFLDVPRPEKERLLTRLAAQGRYKDARSAIDDLKIRSPLVASVVAEMLAKTGSTESWYFERLRELSSESVIAMPHLLSMINSTNPEVRYQIVRTLEAIGPGASNAIPALQARGNDDSAMVQTAAKRAIAAIRGTNSIALETRP